MGIAALNAHVNVNKLSRQSKNFNEPKTARSKESRPTRYCQEEERIRGDDDTVVEDPKTRTAAMSICRSLLPNIVLQSDSGRSSYVKRTGGAEYNVVEGRLFRRMSMGRPTEIL
jgi:hypothetical protein